MKKSLRSLFVIILLISTPVFSHADMIICPAKGISTLESGALTTYPAEITTVGQAIMFILASTDYKVLIGSSQYPSSCEIAGRPIPPEAEQNKVMPIYKALLLLIGNDSRLIIDPDRKLLTFETIC